MKHFNRKPLVAFFLGCAGGYAGGAERINIMIANEFAKRGIEVDLVLMEVKGPYLDSVSPDVNLVDLQAFLGSPEDNPLVKMKRFLAISPLRRYINQRKPYAIVSALDCQNIIAIISRYLARTDCRIIIGQRNTMSQTSNWFIKRIAHLLFPYADRVVAVSRGVADDLIKIIPKIQGKTTVIYNGCDIEKIHLLAQEEPEHPWFKERKHRVILAAGEFRPWKNFPLLIRAFAKVRKKRRVKLVILGDGRERKNLEALVSSLGLNDDVSLPGSTKNPFSYMSRAAVFVLSSMIEGLPNVLIEALACGCPVVSTDCPSGPREILEDGKWGELVPVGDVDALASAIERTLDNPLPKDVLKERASYFSIDRAVDSYLRVVFESERSADA